MVNRRQFLKHAGYATGTALLQPYATWAADLRPPTLPAAALESALSSERTALKKRCPA
jgi:hypothetical protein